MRSPLPLTRVKTKPPPAGGAERLPIGWLRWEAARAVLLLERLVPALLRPAGLLLAFIAAALFGLPQRLPPFAQGGLLLLTGGGALILAWRGLRHVPWPDGRAIARRLEAEAGLPHHPLLAYADRPAIAGAPGLWEAHRAALEAALTRLRLPRPRLDLARHDPWALRIPLVLALIAGLVIEGGAAGDHLARALAPPIPWGTLLPRPVVEAWATPPAYTGLAPFRLPLSGAVRPVPEGTRLVVTVGHARARPRLYLDAKPLALEALDSRDFRSEAVLTASAHLSLRVGWWYHLGLDLSVIPNQKPLLSFTTPPAADPRRSLLRLAWKAEDQWGMRDLAFVFVPLGHETEPPVRVPLAVAAGRTASGRAALDLTASPWAGLPVRAHLEGHDVAGLAGESAEVTVLLPERHFTHPLARRLIEARRVLIRDPAARAGALAILAEGAADTSLFGHDYGGYLNYQAIAALLRRNPDPAAIPEAEARMWELALHFEEGRRGEAARRVAAAEKQLREAMERAKETGKADRAELERLAAELQAALESYLDALAREAKPAPPDAKPDRVVDARTLSALARKMQEDLAAGRLAEAKQDMAALERELRALRAQRRAAADKAREAARRQAEKEAEELKAIARGEQGLLDHAERRLEAAKQARGESWDMPQTLVPPPGMSPPLSLFFHPAPRRGGAPRPGGDAEAGSPSGAPSAKGTQGAGGQEEDREAQAALRQALAAFRKKVGPVGDEAKQNFTEADMAMRQAEAALAEGEDQAAAAAETEALSALVEGGTAMAKARAEARGEGQGDDEEGEGEGSGGVESVTRQGGGGTPDPSGWGQPSQFRLDPLGRAVEEGHGGADDASDVTVPDSFEATESRRIEDELRRREGERTRPPEELHYIERLLDSF